MVAAAEEVCGKTVLVVSLADWLPLGRQGGGVQSGARTKSWHRCTAISGLSALTLLPFPLCAPLAQVDDHHVNRLILGRMLGKLGERQAPLRAGAPRSRG